LDISFVESLARRLASPLGLALFVTMFVATVAALSVVLGWRAFAQRFPATGRPAGDAFHFASASMRADNLPAGYGGCLTVTVGDAGIWISMFFLFRFLHPTIFVPWSAIDSVVEESFFFSRRTVVAIRGFDRRLGLVGAAGERVGATFERMKGSSREHGVREQTVPNQDRP
jgi:hypothetical protein